MTMTTMPTLDLENLDELKALRSALVAARMSRERTISYQANGVTRSVTYASDIETKSALIDLETKIARLEGKPSVRIATVRSVKGFA